MGGAVEFQILGPLKVWSEGKAVPIRGRHHPRLLAVLLCEANNVIAVDSLTRALWEGTPPDTAVQQVQSVISALRRQLGDFASRLRTVHGGYLLEVTDSELDVLRCRRAAGRARELRSRGNLEAASASLRTALDEWRGPSLAGLTGRTIESIGRRLDEYRLELLELRTAIELALGHDEDLIPELRHLATQHPFHQRLSEQLMLALYRTDRAPEALKVFTAISDQLSGELGIDPGPSLRELHTAILREDPSLKAGPKQPESHRTGPGEVPAMLPADTVAFTGRRDHLEMLDEKLTAFRSTPGLVLISGCGGVGKTALAVHWAHGVADKFPDGQLYVNLRGFDAEGLAIDPAEAACSLLEALGVEPQKVPADAEARFGLWRSILADGRYLVVIDNARDAAQVRPLVPGSPDTFTIVTSRNAMAGLVASHGAHPLAIEPLTPEESISLLENRLGGDRVAPEPESVDRIVEACKGLPLALAIITARAATRPNFLLAMIADQLQASRDRLDAFAGSDPETDVRAAFSWSFRALSDDAANMFTILGLHPGPGFSVSAAACLGSVTAAKSGALLQELASDHLLIEQRPGRYAFHDLIKVYARELAEAVEPDRALTAKKRMADHYLHHCDRATEILNPGRDPITAFPEGECGNPESIGDRGQAIQWLTLERQELQRIIDLCAEAGLDDRAWLLASNFFHYAHWAGHWSEASASQHTALAAAQRSKSRDREIYTHVAFGVIATRTDDPERARNHLETALSLCQSDTDPLQLARIHTSFGQILSGQERHSAAVDHDLQALDQFRKAGNRTGEAIILNNTAFHLAKLGRYSEALDYCEQAFALHDEIDGPALLAATWDTRGSIQLRSGDPRKAVDSYQRAIDLAREVSHLTYEVDARMGLSEAYEALGDLAAAQAALQEALEILTEFNPRRAESVRQRLRSLAAKPPTANDTPMPPG